MQKILNLPYKIMFHYKTLGYQGALLLIKRYVRTFMFFNISMPKYPYPLLLRNNSTDIAVFYQIFLAKSYNINYGIDPKVIIDCGANIGLSTVYFKNRFPNAKIIAIEPEASNFEILEKNTKNYENIFCFNGGVWNKCTNLIIKESNKGNWGFVVEEVANKSKDSIPAISIDEIMIKYSVEAIDILKIDIEGSEKELFEMNFENWLKVTKVLVIELHDGLRQGASKSFFSAITKYDFHMSRKDENLIFYFK